MTFKKIPNGEYYYFNQDGNTIMLIRATDNKRGIIPMYSLSVPKELIGKRVRVKLERV